MVEAREKYYTTRSQGFDSSKLLLVMHSSALLLVLKAQHIDSALLVRESTSSRARRAASSFTNKALRSSNLGSSRSSVKYGTAGRGEAIKRCGNLHYIHAGAPYTFTGNEEISIIGGGTHGATTYKNLFKLFTRR